MWPYGIIRIWPYDINRILPYSLYWQDEG
jgi:hypothetical protein